VGEMVEKTENARDQSEKLVITEELQSVRRKQKFPWSGSLLQWMGKKGWKETGKRNCGW